MAVTLRFKINNISLTILLFTLIAFGALLVTAYGGSNPSVMGHSSGELIEADPTVLSSVKDGVSWTEVTNRPASMADNTDNTGVAVESDPTVQSDVKNGVTWAEMKAEGGTPAGFSDDIDGVGGTSGFCTNTPGSGGTSCSTSCGGGQLSKNGRCDCSPGTVRSTDMTTTSYSCTCSGGGSCSVNVQCCTFTSD